jgi:hypothetical protein
MSVVLVRITQVVSSARLMVEPALFVLPLPGFSLPGLKLTVDNGKTNYGEPAAVMPSLFLRPEIRVSQEGSMCS